jgi:hypothetical protein
MVQRRCVRTIRIGIGIAVDHRNSVSSDSIRCRMPANFRATATVPFFVPIRLVSRVPQAFSVDHFAMRFRIIPAASNRYLNFPK